MVALKIDISALQSPMVLLAPYLPMRSRPPLRAAEPLDEEPDEIYRSLLGELLAPSQFDRPEALRTWHPSGPHHRDRRAHPCAHGRATLARGTAVLQPAETAQRNELVLAGHALVGAASLGKALMMALATRSPIRAYRYLNWSVLVRAATTSLQVAGDARARDRDPAQSWDDLLTDVAGPWQLDIADIVDRTFPG